MKREKVIDLGELIRNLWKPSQEDLSYEEAQATEVDLADIDIKVWEEAFKNIEGRENDYIKSIKESQKESKNEKNKVAKTKIKGQEVADKDVKKQYKGKEEREIGE